MPSPEYVALRDKVDAFAAAVAARRVDAIQCRAGCSGCCQVELALSDVEAEALRQALEALDPEARATLAARADVHDGACPLLVGGRCAVYDARPLVCRTQGLPLRYPPDTVPVDAVRARAAGDVVWCPLNFVDAAPRPDDVLDAERVDVMVALVNRRYAQDPLRRTPIRAILSGVDAPPTHRR